MQFSTRCGVSRICSKTCQALVVLFKCFLDLNTDRCSLAICTKSEIWHTMGSVTHRLLRNRRGHHDCKGCLTVSLSVWWSSCPWVPQGPNQGYETCSSRYETLTNHASTPCSASVRKPPDLSPRLCAALVSRALSGGPSSSSFAKHDLKCCSWPQMLSMGTQHAQMFALTLGFVQRSLNQRADLPVPDLQQPV